MTIRPKIGDRIMCCEDGHRDTKGEIGTVVSGNQNGVFDVLWDFNNKVGWCRDNFKIINNEFNLFNGGITI